MKKINQIALSRSYKKTKVNEAMISAVIVIKRKDKIQNFIFIAFASLWLSLVGILLINFADFSKIYFSVSYLIIPFIVIYFKAKEFSNDYTRT